MLMPALLLTTPPAVITLMFIDKSKMPRFLPPLQRASDTFDSA